MRKSILFLAGILLVTISSAQKKIPLDHSVYDGWKSIGERSISNDGKYLAYTINPQEGDGTLVIESTNKKYRLEVPRGYNATISRDSRFAVFSIRPYFKDSREARIKKKATDDMPKDSLGIVELGKDSIKRIARVKSYKMPIKGDGRWLAYLNEKQLPDPLAKKVPDSLAQIERLTRLADSLARVADSIRNKTQEARTKGLGVLNPPKKEKQNSKPAEKIEEGTELVLLNLASGEVHKFELVNAYYFSDSGNVCIIETTRKNGDSNSRSSILWVETSSWKTDTVMKQFNEAKNYALDEGGRQLAFVAERDSVKKALRKFYKLWYYKPGMDSAILRVDRQSNGVGKDMTVSPDYTNRFSKDGRKLFFGLAPVRPVKDTNLVDFETAQLDIWHYNDDYLQPQQLLQLKRELARSYDAVVSGNEGRVVQLGAADAENIFLVDEGNADFVLASSTSGNRVTAQWEGFSRQTVYIISTRDGSRKLVKNKLRGFASASPNGKYVAWYDMQARNYFSYAVAKGTTSNISASIKQPLWDEEDDHPDDPPAHGIAGWTQDDQRLLIYDRYDIWEVDPVGNLPPVNLTAGIGRANQTELRYQRLDRDERFISPGQKLLLRAFNQKTKYAGYYEMRYKDEGKPTVACMLPNSFGGILKAEGAERFLVQQADINSSELCVSDDLRSFTRLTAVADQQQPYNWLSVELKKWKMFDGKEAEGLLFKPENFDPAKKYPIIFYFYERNADGLYTYRAPAPSASTINIPYFASNGYLVFVPDIWYKNGEPGESAYNSVVSAAKYLAKFPWVDSTRMAIQGQSWGGYQVAYLVTRTKMFAAAGAGAPVANMTSAYGGIRWGSGLNRQFQYERSQSRIGATLWQRRDLYIRNSPLFNADKVTTPLLIMHNDLDGSVPWYQGIEYFTALRRLGKKVWLLEYNGEDHNLVQRRNRKDLSIRLGQFFDYYLKGAAPAKWIAEGVPATLKGIDWGTEPVGSGVKSF